jgi:alcohol dehydrogenase class IV
LISAFHWIDGERTIVFGRGKLAGAHGLIGQDPYVLLTTERASRSAPEIAEGAVAVLHVPDGRVDEIAAALRPDVKAELIVALGGGRVIDTAKALAAADPPRRVAAIPTTLSGAEMTAVHRHAAGVAADTPRVRPALVVNDPSLSASQPPFALAASAGNAIGHALEGPLTPLRNPAARLAGQEAGRLIAAALGHEARAAESVEGRDRLALGSLLAGYVIGSTGYGLHHVLSQTLVRFAGIGHGPANTIMLPHTAAALGRRFPAEVQEFGQAVGGDAVAFARRLCELTGHARLREVAETDETVLERCAEEASRRPELAMTPPAAGREEILALYRVAW